MADHIDIAHYQAELALQHLAVAKWAFAGPMRRDHTRYAEGHLAKCAASLGFDLVKRQTPAEMHSAAIAARVAEDRPAVTDKPGFDGRQRLEDMEWSR